MTRDSSSLPAAKPLSDPLLAEIVRRLVAAYHPTRVYLFGSLARAEAGPDSDYDLLLVGPDDAAEPRRGSRLAYEALRGTGAAADRLGCTRTHFEERPHPRAPPPATATPEGVLLHAA